MALGLRSRIKSGLKRVFGADEPAPPPPPPAAPPPPPPVRAVAPEPDAPDAPEVAPDAEGEAAPASAATGGGSITREAVQELLDDMVRPALQADGGDITLINVEDDTIYVKLVGACSTCPSSIATMKGGVELLLKEEFPMLKDVVQVDA